MTSGDSIVQRASGTLFVVATPIGNLGDLSDRARATLRDVALLLAEDTRHSGQLLRTLGIERALESLHEHNEAARVPGVLARLAAGDDVALVSDAGTPLVSDPGFVLVSAAARAGVAIVAVPGACAAIAALTVSALPCERFSFEGFPPSKVAARREWLAQRAHDTRTTIYYEAPHRIVATLADMVGSFGAGRAAVVAREMTKKFESVYRGTLGELATRAGQDADMARGEIVIVVHGAAPAVDSISDAQSDRVLRALLTELPTATAARLAAKITGRGRRELYARALQLGAIDDA